MATTALWTIDVATRELQKVRDADPQDISVAPDGPIAYSCRRGEDARLCLTDRSGADLGFVPNSSSFTTSRWSPDGHWIAFTAFGGYADGLVVLRADGSERRVLVHERVSEGIYNGGVGVAWLPDSSRVAFELDRPDGKADPCPHPPPCPDDSGIWSVRIDGADARPLTQGSRDQLMEIRTID